MVSRKTRDIILMFIIAVLTCPFGALMYYVLTHDTYHKYRRKIHTRKP